MKNISK